MPSSDAYSPPPVNESAIYHAQYAGGPAAQQPDRGGASRSGGGSASSAPEFRVDSDGVRSRAAELARCGERAAQVIERLRSALESGGMPWGTDELGKRFGHSYTGPANQGFASIAGLGAALVNVAGELAAQADDYDALEQHITGAIGRTGRQDATGSSAGA